MLLLKKSVLPFVEYAHGSMEKVATDCNQMKDPMIQNHRQRPDVILLRATYKITTGLLGVSVHL